MRYRLCTVLYNIAKHIPDYFYTHPMDKFFSPIFNFYLSFDDMFEYADIYVMLLNSSFSSVFLLSTYVFLSRSITNELSHVIVGLHIDRVDGYLLRGRFKAGPTLRNTHKALLYALMTGHSFNKWVVKRIDITVPI